MPKVAYQTYIVHILVLFNVLIALIAGNVLNLHITDPWITLVLIPFAVGAGTYGANQLKSIGSGAPGTVETTTVKVTPPVTPPARPAGVPDSWVYDPSTGTYKAP